MMQRFAHFIIRFRLAVIIITLLITAALGFFIKDLRVNPDITTYLPADDSIVTRFNYIGRNYSSSSLAMVIMESDDIFSAGTLENIRKLTDTLKNLGGVDYVTSLTTVLDIRSTPDSSIEIRRLVDEFNLPQTPEELKETKNYVLAQKLYVGRLVSADARYTTLICRINQDFDKNEISGRIKEAVMKEKLPEKIYFEGLPFQLLNIFDYIIRDLVLLVPLIIVLIAATLFLSFRSLRGMLVPVLTVAIGIVWTMGLMAIFHVNLTPLSDAIPVVLFAIGSAYGIHVVNRFNATVTDPDKRKEQSAEALKNVGVPVFLAGVTTFMGLISFIIGAYLVIVRDFGIFSSLGVLFILTNSLTFTPAVLSYLKPLRRKARKEKSSRFNNLLSLLMHRLSDIATERSKTVLIAALVIIFGSAAGIPFIKNKIDILNYFREGSSIRQSARIMNDEFGGSIPLMIIARGDIQDPAVLSEISKFQAFLNQQPGVQNAQSIADFIEKMNDAMGEGERIPDKREKVSNLWFMLEGEENLKQLVNNEKTEAVIQAFMVNTDTRGYHTVNDAVDKYIENVVNPGVVFVKTGMPAVYANLDVSLMKNLIQSMIISMLLIFVTMVFLVRSLKGALTGIIPLLFAMIFIFGFMGAAGIALDIATVLIASITVGAGIDYSIHFVSAYRSFIKQGQSVNEAIRQTMLTSGRAIIINVLTVCFGFLVLIFANLLPLMNFGILIAVTMFISGLGAVTVLPAFLSRFKVKLARKKNNGENQD